ncbi:hypothetical protein [Hymenobacter sp. YC55]|uniref:hypothetical protein n=1 Tax=Hymenobacter sp. YC55 TaxID=3034019 RepID=UPI0023F6F59F|nr:hypothetical protein [Hymenobacter sp. YC55]MDF7815187.1 hypothetical protein [Hymenobacter sp. YC55]
MRKPPPVNPYRTICHVVQRGHMRSGLLASTRLGVRMLLSLQGTLDQDSRCAGRLLMGNAAAGRSALTGGME